MTKRPSLVFESREGVGKDVKCVVRSAEKLWRALGVKRAVFVVVAGHRWVEMFAHGGCALFLRNSQQPSGRGI